MIYNSFVKNAVLVLPCGSAREITLFESEIIFHGRPSTCSFACTGEILAEIKNLEGVVICYNGANSIISGITEIYSMSSFDGYYKITASILNSEFKPRLFKYHSDSGMLVHFFADEWPDLSRSEQQTVEPVS